jgi:hypothetical protein
LVLSCLIIHRLAVGWGCYCGGTTFIEPIVFYKRKKQWFATIFESVRMG